MTRTFTIALFACAIAATPTRAQQQTSAPPASEAQKPVSPLPDEWKFKTEKEKEKEKDKEKTKDSGQRPESWRMEQEKARDREKAGGSADAADAGAQPRSAAKPKAPWRGWSDRAIVSVNGGWQSASFDLQDRREFAPDVPGDRERRTMTADYAVESGVALDLGGLVRVWKGLGAGVAVTRFKDTRDIPVNGTVPHPFFFNRPRAVSGAIEGTREEIGVHLQAAWVVPVSPKLQIALFGGPTFYRVKQTVVTGFTWSEAYPYDEVALTRLATEEESTSVTGVNVGADVGYYFTNAIGVGGIVRFGRGSVDSQLGSLDVGGPEVGVGVRIRLR